MCRVTAPAALRPSESSSATDSGSTSSPTSSCSPPSSRPTRCWHPRPPEGRPRGNLFDPRQCRHRDRLPAGLELRLRYGQHRGRVSATRNGRRSRCSSPACWASCSCCWSSTSSAAWWLEAPGRPAAPSCTAFFTLVGCHGLHVTAGLLWLGTMMAQFYAKGFRRDIQYRYLCFSLFWHALDIIWVAIFSLVYLVGINL